MRGIVLVLLIAAGCGPARGARPNIIVMVADDLRWDALGCAGNPVLKTPHIDRLAAGGTLFRNAFVTTSICSVSRASILTGQYARRHKVNDFKTPIADPGATYPVILRRAGYWTGFIGKWGTAQSDREYFKRCAADFDFWAGDMVQTSYWHGSGCNYVTNDGTTNRANFFCDCPGDAVKAEGVGSPEGGIPHPSIGDPRHLETQIIPAKIRSFLEQRDSGKPFCLSVSFKAPHGPWGGYAPEFAADFEGVDMPARPTVNVEDALRQPDFLRASLESDRGLRHAQDPTLAGERQRNQRCYYRLIEGLDKCVGGIVEELEKRGLADGTAIVFTSDNGHFLGEHGFFGKWLMHEESIRVPLIVAGAAPHAKRGQACEGMALNIDVAPTVLELAGLPVPRTMQGVSLVPQMKDPAAFLRDEFFYEHLYEHAAEPPRHIEPSEGVRTRTWKYIVYPKQRGPGAEALFDLQADPLERENLAQGRAQAERLGAMRLRIKSYRKILE